MAAPIDTLTSTILKVPPRGYIHTEKIMCTSTDPAAVAACRYLEARHVARAIDAESGEEASDPAYEHAEAFFQDLAVTEATTLAGLRAQAAVLADSLVLDATDNRGGVDLRNLDADKRLALTVCRSILRLVGGAS